VRHFLDQTTQEAFLPEITLDHDARRSASELPLAGNIRELSTFLRGSSPPWKQQDPPVRLAFLSLPKRKIASKLTAVSIRSSIPCREGGDPSHLRLARYNKSKAAAMLEFTHASVQEDQKVRDHPAFLRRHAGIESDKRQVTSDKFTSVSSLVTRHSLLRCVPSSLIFVDLLDAGKDIKNFRISQRVLVQHFLAFNHLFHGKLNLFHVKRVGNVRDSDDLGRDVSWLRHSSEGCS